MQVTASNVDLATAQGAAQRFLMNKAAKGRFMTSAPAVKWTHQAKNSTNAALTAYYVVNTEAGYAIVAGDSRAREILAYGEGQIQSMNDLPDAVQYFLDIYQKQMEYLQAHPGLMVQKTANRGGVSVAPMLKTAWGQGAPYNRRCPKVSRDYCKVGCSAVSLAQVMKYWQYPDKSPALPGYTGEEFGVTVDALPEYTFDWDNMEDSYEGLSISYIDNVMPDYLKDAIAYFMRYVGQAETMDYGAEKSGAGHEGILQAIQTFGFDPGAHIEMKWDYDDGTVNYTEEAWAELIQSELRAGRPLVYCAFDTSGQGESFGIAGHSFNVDGYDAETDMYHVNFGMTPTANTFYALDAFAYDFVTVYDFYPLLFAGVQPPGLSTDPRIFATPNALNMEAYVGENATKTFDVTGDHLTEGVTVTLNDETGAFSIDATTVALNETKTITVTYAPEAVGTHEATITLSSAGAEDVTVTLKGTATKAPVVKYDPVMQPATDINLNSFRAVWTDQTAEGVASYTLDVKEKQAGAPELLAEVDWSNVPSSGYADAYLPEGWTMGPYTIYCEGDGVSITSKNYIKTNTLEIGTDKVTVVFKARAYHSWIPSGLTVKTSVDSKAYELNSQDYTEYTVVLNCAEADQIEFYADSYDPTIQSIQIYAGELQAPALRANVTGDASHYVITGITDKYYDVKNLNNEGTYVYKVKAIYTDGTESKWSNAETVTLKAGGQTYAQGDVNMDGSVNISDVTDLIDMLLSDNTKPSGDVNGDGSINITDVTDLIDLLLKN
jgi:hypothetical protein